MENKQNTLNTLKKIKRKYLNMELNIKVIPRKMGKPILDFITNIIPNNIQVQYSKYKIKVSNKPDVEPILKDIIPGLHLNKTYKWKRRFYRLLIYRR